MRYLEDVYVQEFIAELDRKSTRLNSSHLGISYAVFCLKKKKDYTSQDGDSYGILHDGYDRQAEEQGYETRIDIRLLAGILSPVSRTERARVVTDTSSYP